MLEGKKAGRDSQWLQRWEAAGATPRWFPANSMATVLMLLLRLLVWNFHGFDSWYRFMTSQCGQSFKRVKPWQRLRNQNMYTQKSLGCFERIFLVQSAWSHHVWFNQVSFLPPSPPLLVAGSIWQLGEAHTVGDRVPGKIHQICQGEVGNRSQLCKTD